MKPESRFRNAIHKKLPSWVYHEASSALFSNGTPDDYYESLGGFCRIEYKHYDKPPTRAPLALTKEIGKARKSKLSAAQQRWLSRAYNNGMPVYVIVGFGAGRDMCGIILFSPDEWAGEVSVADVHDQLLSPTEIALAIEKVLIQGVRDESEIHKQT